MQCHARATTKNYDHYVKRVERVRLYPTSIQQERLVFVLDVTRELYNALLQERREAWRRGIAVTRRQQYAELTELRREDPRIAAVYRECQDAVLHRLDLAFKAFFRRVQKGQKPGYPRYKQHRRFAQIEFPHGKRALRFTTGQTKIIVPGIGSVRLRKGRLVPDFGRAWIMVKNGRWHACFECERAFSPLAPTGQAIGVDRGVHVLAATSEAMLVRNPKYGERSRRKLQRLQRTLERRKRRGKNRLRAAAELARLHEHVACQRRDYLHKVARRMINRNDIIILEALNLPTMTRSAKGTLNAPGRNVRAKSALNRAMLDASFGQLHRLLSEKAEEAARRVVLVDSSYSSQTCSQCGHVAAKSRRRRRFACVKCGFKVHSDVNAALVIRRRAELPPAGRGAALADLRDLRSLPYAAEKPAGSANSTA